MQCIHGNIVMPILTFVNHSASEASNPFTSHAPQCCCMHYAVQSNHNSFHCAASWAESYYSKTFINITGVSLCPVMSSPVQENSSFRKVIKTQNDVCAHICSERWRFATQLLTLSKHDITHRPHTPKKMLRKDASQSVS